MKLTLAIIAATILLIMFLNVRGQGQDWHNSMALQMRVKNTCLKLLDSRFPETIRAKAQANIIQSDQIILKEASRKPYWAAFTADEIKAPDEARSDLGEVH